jgi:hypothetical protein
VPGNRRAGNGQLTLATGSRERLARISRESTKHGFTRVDSGISGPEAAEAEPNAVLRTKSGFEVTLVCA